MLNTLLLTKVGDKMNNNVRRPNFKRALVKKDYIKTFIYKSIFVLLTLLILLFIKKINIDSTNNIIRIVEKNINYEFDLVNDGKKLYKNAQSLVNKSLDTIEVFGGTKRIYDLPINGVIKNNYGDKIRVNGVIVENTGVEIQVDSEKNPISIIDGEIIKIERKEKKGYFVTIKNEDIEIVYGYLNKVFLKEGEAVKVGIPVGEIGENKDGLRYLRIEVLEDGVKVDPNDYINF